MNDLRSRKGNEISYVECRKGRFGHDTCIRNPRNPVIYPGSDGAPNQQANIHFSTER
jgi:hypothetical protein